MGKFFEFMRAAGRLGGGSVLVALLLFGITALEHWQRHNVAVSVFGILGILVFCYGSFIAWDQERGKRIAVEKEYFDQRPRLLLIIKTSISGADFRALHSSAQTTICFSIQHLSGRPATEVNVDPIRSEIQDFQLRLQPLPYVMPGTSGALGFEVWENQVVPDPKIVAKVGWDCMLPVFFNTCDMNIRTHHYDVCVRYRDRDANLIQRYKFGFDVKEQRLLPAMEVVPSRIDSPT